MVRKAGSLLEEKCARFIESLDSIQDPDITMAIGSNLRNNNECSALVYLEDERGEWMNGRVRQGSIENRAEAAKP